MNPTMNMTISLSFVVYVLENKLTGQFSLKKMTAAIGFPVYAEDLPHRPEWRGFIIGSVVRRADSASFRVGI